MSAHVGTDQRSPATRSDSPDRPGDLPDPATRAREDGSRDPQTGAERGLRRRSWLDNSIGVGSLVTVAALWLIASPIPITYSGGALDLAAPILAGAALLILVSLWATQPEEIVLPAAIVAVGVTLMLIAHWATDAEPAVWNLRITGGFIVFLAFAGAAAASSGLARRA